MIIINVKIQYEEAHECYNIQVFIPKNVLDIYDNETLKKIIKGCIIEHIDDNFNMHELDNNILNKSSGGKLR
ncbi:MAG: hypothetical protein FWC41_00145 [Firmicutes bacterium]|nr:hypothetical protein [Bacillota bacterium]